MASMQEHGFLSKQIIEWIAQNREANSDWFGLCEHFNKLAHEVLYQLKPHNKDLRELLLSTLFIRCLTSFQGVMILAERGMLSEARMVLRCLMEALFALRAIECHPEIIPLYIEQDKKFRQNLINKFEISSEQVRSVATPDELTELKKTISKEMPEEGIEKLKTVDLADKAGLLDLYNTGYTLLSLSVHSHARDLQVYLDIDDEQRITALNYGPSDKGIETILYSAADCVRLSMASVNDAFGLASDMQLRPLYEKLEEYRFQIINSVSTKS